MRRDEGDGATGGPGDGRFSQDDGGAAPREGRGLTPGSISRLRSLIQILESEIPESYRVEMFRLLAPEVLPESEVAPAPSPTAEQSPTIPPVTATATPADPRLGTAQLDLGPYTSVLASPGKTLLKSLTALDVAFTQLGIQWMTPGEVERFLVERVGSRSIYRTNVSNALSKARGMVDRRRRGRGYEYRLTAFGRDTLHRELRLIGE